MALPDLDLGFTTFLLIGFCAQLIDGALGMAFGTLSMSALLSCGVPPAQASAIVHTAEVFTTATSATAHVLHKNINRRLVLELSAAGAAGAALGAYVLSNIDGRVIRPFIAAYLLVIGLSILFRAVRRPPQSDASPAFAAPLGIVGGFLDAVGGGGWGATVTSTLLGSGHAPRMVIGSVNTAEFFVTTAAATTFFLELGMAPMKPLLGLLIGGVLAAPLGAYVVRYVPARGLMLAAGLLIVGLAGYQLLQTARL